MSAAAPVVKKKARSFKAPSVIPGFGATFGFTSSI